MYISSSDNTMKKFLSRICIYTIIVLSIVAAVNVSYLKTFDDCETIKNVPQNVEICNFGSSHGANGFNYEDAGRKYTCVNFALHSQTLLYDYSILQNFKDNLKPGAAVFIVISYFSFFGRPEVEGKNFIANNKRYYKFLPPELILQYDRITDIYVNYLPAMSPKALLRFAKVLITGNNPSLEINNPKPYGRRLAQGDMEALTRKTNAEEAKDDAVESFGRHFGTQRDKSGKRLRRQAAFDSIYGMIDLCRKIGARPIMVTVPYTPAYTDIIRKEDPEFFPEFYAVIDEIRSKTGVEYYDYGCDERFCGDYGFFLNSDHMNLEGARRFTNTILHEVLSLDVE